MGFGRGALWALCALGLSGCATYVSGTRQLIAITTPPVNSAYCELTRPGYRWRVTTPGVVRVDKSVNDIAIRCTRPGYQDAAAIIPSSIEAWTFGNLFFGGVTAGMDAATGAMGSYPDSFALPMMPDGGTRLPLAPPPASAPEPAKPPLPGTLPDNF